MWVDWISLLRRYYLAITVIYYDQEGILLIKIAFSMRCNIYLALMP